MIFFSQELRTFHQVLFGLEVKLGCIPEDMKYIHHWGMGTMISWDARWGQEETGI